MKTKLFITLLFPLGLTAQTVKVSTSSNLSAPVVPTQAGMTAAITAQAKLQSGIDAKQDAILNNLPKTDTTGLVKIIDGKVVILQDPAIPILKSQVAAIQTQDKATASAITTLQAQNTAMQKQLNEQQALIDKLTVQLAGLIEWQSKVKAANQ